ncbi:MAG: hypothetical protein LBB20_01925 [Puniceicoccales bacterium]|jgi:hypothetical protein|nr:hypothetical protein [Puniceicoccales bacterium]
MIFADICHGSIIDMEAYDGQFSAWLSQIRMLKRQKRGAKEENVPRKEKEE